MTATESKTFKTRSGAERWLAQRGFNPDGSALEKPLPREIDVVDLHKMGVVEITHQGNENIYFVKDGREHYSKVMTTENYPVGEFDLSKYPTGLPPAGFVTDNRSNLSLFINQLNNKVFEFAKTEGLAVIGAMSEAKFSTAIKNAAEAKESSLDNSGESVYSEMEQYLYVDDLAALEVRANQNPLYQSVIDGAPITRELLVELEQAGQQEAEPVSNNQLTQATTIAVEFMQSMVQQAMEAA